MALTNVSIKNAKWLAANSSAFNLRILDLRNDPYEYFESHVPGAVHISEAAFRAPKNGIPVQYLPAEQTADLLTRAGIFEESVVVLYSNGADVLGATMLSYILEKLGHRDIVILDGGLSEFIKTQRVSRDYPSYSTGRFLPRENRLVRADLEDVKRALRNGTSKFIDARPSKSYRGEVPYWPRNGHLPGAINIYWRTLTDSANAHSFKNPDELKQIYYERGIKESDDLILYCGTSREASIEYFALKHILGFRKVRLYEGSWTEYSTYRELPMEVGEN